MAGFPELQTFRIISRIYRNGDGTISDLSAYPYSRIDRERAILDSLKHKCPKLEAVRLSEGCHWWYDEGWVYELRHEFHTDLQLGQ